MLCTAESGTARLTVFSAGQTLIEEDLSHCTHPDFLAIRSLAHNADLGFTNFEGTVRAGEATKIVNLHGIEPELLDFLPWMGFKLLSLANNHAFDHGARGLQATVDEVRRRDLAGAGAGCNLSEAQKPAYLNTPKGRIALIAMTSTNALPEIALASDSSTSEEGRPGVNPLRHESLVQTVLDDEWEYLKRLAERIGLTVRNKRDVACGWQVDTDGILHFAEEARFLAGEGYAQQVKLNQADRARNLKQISDAAKKADYVLVSLHDHLWAYHWQDVLPWKRAFAKACIDAGADAFLGHGVPALSGIEIYENHPIFYGLGNFVFHETPGKWHVQEVWESVGALIAFDRGQLASVQLVPVVLGDKAGHCDGEYDARRYPFMARGDRARGILERVERLSAPFGTRMRIEEGIGVLRL